MGIDWVSMRLNIAKCQGEFGNREEILEVVLDMANGRMLWQVTENNETARGF